MSTRHLTVAVKNNKIVLSQYGQWDGYFTGAGLDFLEFCKKLQNKDEEYTNYNIKKFAEKFIYVKEANKEILNKIDEVASMFSRDTSKNTTNYAIPFTNLFPSLSRDTGVDILNIINNLDTNSMTSWKKIDESKGNEDDNYKEIKMKYPIIIDLDKEGYCEYANVINLDTKEIYMLTIHDFNSEALDTCKLIENTYSGMACYYKSKIQNLPSLYDIEEKVKEIGL